MADVDGRMADVDGRVAVLPHPVRILEPAAAPAGERAAVAEVLAAAAGVVVRGAGVAATARAVAAARAALPAGAPVLADCPAVADPAAALALLDAGATAVLLSSGLVEAGPGLFARVTEAVLSRRHAARPARGTGRPGRPGRPGRSGRRGRSRRWWYAPRRWPRWIWGALLGAGMVAVGAGAVAITAGPLPGPYDLAFLGTSADRLGSVSPRLAGFLRHDRVTLAGAIVSIGVLYTGLAAGGMRPGWPWARTALLASGAVGFPTLLYFLGFGYLDPLHGAATAVLLPAFLLAVLGPPDRPKWTVQPDGPEPPRHRALVGQLLLVVVAVGLLGGGVVLSVIGLAGGFVPSDLHFLPVTADAAAAADPRLAGFVAADRAGFGGALVAAGVAVLLLTVWGWRPGARWVWWTLLLAAVSGFGATLAAHLAVGYRDLPHLAPVLAAAAASALALGLSHGYLCARPVPTGAADRRTLGCEP
jgi:hypothetical protein